MDSEDPSHRAGESPVTPHKAEQPASDRAAVLENGIQRSHSRSPELQHTVPAAAQDAQELARNDTPDNLADLEPFDWEAFEQRYEQALVEADQIEASILEEADSLSKYFKVWVSTASAHDNERAVKRLRTQSRYVAMAEANAQKKQEHYEQVILAFEGALALLRSQ